MDKVAVFEKVSYEQFKKDYKRTFEKYFFGECPKEEYIKEVYDNIQLPTRATKCSAGHDFFAYEDIKIEAGSTILIPTGVKCHMVNGWMLNIFPRSGLGFNYGVRLANTVGIIDGDYYNNKNNEGHIFIKLVNDAKFAKDLIIKKDTAYCQGIFIKYGIVSDDNVNAERTGGFGSTNKADE